MIDYIGRWLLEHQTEASGSRVHPNQRARDVYERKLVDEAKGRARPTTPKSGAGNPNSPARRKPPCTRAG